MTRRPVVAATAELAGWWAVVALLWLMLISTVDTLETLVGAGVAAAGTIAARAGRRAVHRR
jgi:hypothetical protein